MHKIIMEIFIPFFNAPLPAHDDDRHAFRRPVRPDRLNKPEDTLSTVRLFMDWPGH